MAFLLVGGMLSLFSFNNWSESLYVGKEKVVSLLNSMQRNEILTDKEYQALFRRSSRMSFEFFNKVKGLAASRIEGKSKNYNKLRERGYQEFSRGARQERNNETSFIIDEDTSQERQSAEALARSIDEVFN